MASAHRSGRRVRETLDDSGSLGQSFPSTAGSSRSGSLFFGTQSPTESDARTPGKCLNMIRPGFCSDTAHTLLSDALAAVGIYVGVTRCRERNKLDIVATDLDDASQQSR